MTSEDILDVVERKNYQSAMVRELGIYDKFAMNSDDDTIPVIRRIDALLIRSLVKTAIEVKITKNDYRKETEEKRRMWRSVTHRYIYVCPEGIILPEEVPDYCGLWWITERYKGFKECNSVKNAIINKSPDQIPERVFMNLCYREQKLRKAIKNK